MPYIYDNIRKYLEKGLNKTLVQMRPYRFGPAFATSADLLLMDKYRMDRELEAYVEGRLGSEEQE